LILFNLHKSPIGAHQGIENTYQKLKERYYWPGMRNAVKHYIKGCDECQRRGQPFRKEPLIPIKIGEPFHRVGIDIKGPLPITKKENRYIIVAMDYLTKWPEAKATSEAKASDVAKFLHQEIICRHGTPSILLSDRGTPFVNALIKELCEKGEIRHRLTSPYRPQTNGMVERFNRTIGESLAKMTSNPEKEWDEYLDAILLAYRTMKHESTGFTPFQLIYGRQARLPIELKVTTHPNEYSSIEEALMQRTVEITNKMIFDQAQARENIKKKQERMKKYHGKISDKLKIGDKVLLFRNQLQGNLSAKLEEKWTGPYYIHEVLGANNYKLRTLEGRLVKNTVHGERLKLYWKQALEPLIVI
jgi:hypothetical protein